ncbi:helix-turn-helix domain-containing protein [Paenibacillus piscarius]|uniref:helix-turn-helix domain-containing protein n=1 Tax=Paenibacillus piscarius TaxID=1089681 RepID=UPI001EE7C2AA|nr:helix-turn-helix domain-containing protein [Paenibacillus piscarius]
MMRRLDKGSMIRAEADAEYAPAQAQAVTLFVVLEGTVGITINEERYELSADDVVAVNRGEYYEVKKITSSNLLFTFVISDSLIHNTIYMAGLRFDCNSAVHRSSHYAGIQQDVLHILDILVYNNRRINFLYLSHVYHLLNTLIQNFSRMQAQPPDRDDRIQRIEEYIKEHYADNISLKAVAARFYMDHAYLSRQFKKSTQVNFKEYLAELRLGHAEHELVHTERKVAEIALEHGFFNVASFNKAFKKKHDLTPSEYREQHKIQESQAVPAEDEQLKTRYFTYLESYKRSSSGQPPDMKKKIKLKSSGHFFPANWNSILNIGAATHVLQDDCQQHISLLKHELDYTYARIYVHEDIALDQMNTIIDFILTQRLTPWLVVEYHPNASTGWLKTLLNHLSNRFGERLMKKWLFELSARKAAAYSREALYAFFRQFRGLIKHLSEEIMVGGFSQPLTGGHSEDVFRELDADFYAFSMFSRTTVPSGNGTAEIINRDSGYFNTALQELSARNLRNKPVYITEWGISDAPQNYLADSLYTGAFTIYNIIAVHDKIAGMGGYLASDLFDPRTPGHELLSGKPGLLTRHGMFKPAMNAMKFLAELRNVEIAYADDQVLAGTIGRDEIYILFSNYTHPNDLYFIKPEQEINRTDLSLFFAEAEASLSLELSNLEDGVYEIRRYRCSRGEGNLLNQWRELDYTQNIRPSDLAYLKVKNMINMSLKEIEITNRSFTIREQVRNNDFFVINMRKQRVIH